jgi:hypothetical protein
MLHYEAIFPNAALVLNEIFNLPVRSHLYLSGSSALALYLGHRTFSDFDCALDDKVEWEDFLTQIPTSANLGKPEIGNSDIKFLRDGTIIRFATKEDILLNDVVTIDEIRICSFNDAVAMSLYLTAAEGNKSHFYDIYFLLQQLPLKEMLELFKQKYSNCQLMMAIKGLTYFEDAENDEDPKLLKEKVTWPQVKEKIKSEVKIFHG